MPCTTRRAIRSPMCACPMTSTAPPRRSGPRAFRRSSRPGSRSDIEVVRAERRLRQLRNPRPMWRQGDEEPVGRDRAIGRGGSAKLALAAAAGLLSGCAADSSLVEQLMVVPGYYDTLG